MSVKLVVDVFASLIHRQPLSSFSRENPLLFQAYSGSAELRKDEEGIHLEPAAQTHDEPMQLRCGFEFENEG